jgi:GT2 family glycosyltransferase
VILRPQHRQWLLSFLWKALRHGGTRARALARLSRPLAEEAAYQDWIRRTEPRTEALAAQRREVESWEQPPLLSILMPVYSPPLRYLAAALDSVRAQTYERWELCVADGGPPGNPALSYLQHLAATEPRIRLKALGENRGIGANSNAAIEMVQGEFVAFLDQDDLLSEDALYRMAQALRANPGLDVIYSDKDNVTPWGQRYAALLKPDWSPDLLRSANYLTHLTMIRRSLVDSVGGFDEHLDGAQDWDLFLRVTESTSNVGHVPHVLYHWRSLPTSCASGMDSKPFAEQAQLRTVEAHLWRSGIPGMVVRHASGDLRIHAASHDCPPVVLITWPISSEQVRQNLARILDQHASDPIQLVSTDQCQLPDRADSRVRRATGGGGSWASAMNSAARMASGELLLFWDPRLLPADRGWLSELALWAAPEVGLVGAHVSTEDGIVRQSGLIVGVGGGARSLFEGARECWTVLGSPNWNRNHLAVSPGCVMTTRAVWERLGGFEGLGSPLAAVLDFGVRAHELGLRNVYVPFVRLLQTSPMSDTAANEPAALPTSARPYLSGGDPFFNRNLSRTSTVPRVLEIPEPHDEPAGRRESL